MPKMVSTIMVRTILPTGDSDYCTANSLWKDHKINVFSAPTGGSERWVVMHCPQGPDGPGQVKGEWPTEHEALCAAARFALAPKHWPDLSDADIRQGEGSNQTAFDCSPEAHAEWDKRIEALHKNGWYSDSRLSIVTPFGESPCILLSSNGKRR